MAFDKDRSPHGARPSVGFTNADGYPAWALILLGGAALALGALVLALGLPLAAPPNSLLIVHVLVGWSFLGSSVVALAKRPRNPVGLLMATVGGLWFLPAIAFAGSPIAVAVGVVADGVFWAPLAHLLLSFPTGRLESTFNRFVVIFAYVWIPSGNTLSAMFLDPASAGCIDCPPNPLMLRDDPAAFAVMSRVDAALGAVLAIAVLGLLVRRWHRASAPARRVLRPVWWAVWPAFLVAVVFIVFDLLDLPNEDLVQFLPLMNLALAVLPVAFLVSLLRTRLDRSMVSDLLIELQRPLPQRGLRDALAAALGDDSLELGLWLPDIGRHVSNRGSQLDLVNVENTGNRYATEVRDSDGKPLAVLIHDPALLDDPLRVEAVMGAARLALENERLQAQLLAQLEEVRASRIRIVEAGDQARRRLERDLHDGAQQRLLALSLAVERARSLSANFGSSALADLLADVTDQLKMSLAELRELARGIHPALLTDEGLLPAVDSIARRAQVPTKIVSIPTERYPVAVEAAAYYVIAEALTNAARHSAATEILVQVDRDEEWLQIEVSDDGRGGADPTHGSGLRGLEDRIVSIGGVLRISSPLGEGTCLLARIPITSTVAPE